MWTPFPGRDSMSVSRIWVILQGTMVLCSPLTFSAEIADADDVPSAPMRVLVHCSSCHSQPDPEANVPLDEPLKNAGTPPHMDLMERALKAVQSGKMPPSDSTLLNAEEREALIRELKSILVQSSIRFASSRPSSGNRRLTRAEYNYTLQELFGVDAEFADLLPADPISTEGYRNSVERNELTSLHFEAYLASARRAVRRYVQFEGLGSTMQTTARNGLRYAIEFEELFYSTADRYAGLERAPSPISHDEFLLRRRESRSRDVVYTDPLSARVPGAFSEDEMLRAAIPKLHQQYVAYPQRLDVGELVVRVRAAGVADRFGRFPMMQVEAGITLGDGCSIDSRKLGAVEVTAPLDAPEIYEFRIRLEDLPAKGDLDNKQWVDRLSVFDLNQLFISNYTPDTQAIFEKGRGAYRTPDEGSRGIASQLASMKERQVNLLYLDRLEIEMLPGVADGNHPYRWCFTMPSELDQDRVADVLQAEVKDTLREFMVAAFRRPVTEEEVDAKLDLLSTFLKQGMEPAESLHETFSAVLVSRAFLYQTPQLRKENRLTHEQRRSFQRASQLSFALWMQGPDAELFELASRGRLVEDSTVRAQVVRLLNDARSQRFLEDFAFNGCGWIN